jgi:hypothetical protein
VLRRLDDGPDCCSRSCCRSSRRPIALEPKSDRIGSDWIRSEPSRRVRTRSSARQLACSPAGNVGNRVATHISGEQAALKRPHRNGCDRLFAGSSFGCVCLFCAQMIASGRLLCASRSRAADFNCLAPMPAENGPALRGGPADWLASHFVRRRDRPPDTSLLLLQFPAPTACG